MKVYVLTEINLRHVGYSPNKVYVFPTHAAATKKMAERYREALDEFGSNEDSEMNVLDEGGYAYVGNADYRLDIYECDLGVDEPAGIETIQELTVVAEEMGVREKLMTDRDMSRDEVWLLMQKWTAEFLAKYEKECKAAGHPASDVSFYDMIDEFVEHKYAELDMPEVELRADPMVIDHLFLCDKDKFGDVEEHPAKLQVYDGYAIGDGVRLEYPKLADLTREQIKRIDDYIGGRIADSGFVCPDDVCIALGEVVSFTGVMDTGQNHDAELVRRINLAWMEKKDAFRPVLVALYERDIKEILDGPNYHVFGWPEAADTDYAYSAMQTDWEDYATRYLKYVADDRDLQCILDFVRV